MPKGRHLKPDFFTDKNIVSVSPLARLLYQGLWCYAADCGHLDDEPIEFKLRILPADNCDIEELLAELVNKGRIVRENGVIFLPKLREHGRVDKRYETACDACKSRSEHGVRPPSRDPNHDVTTTGTRSEHDVTTRAGTPNHDADGDGDGDGDGDISTSPPTPIAARSADADRGFDDWWGAYPRKVGKGQARKAYRAAAKKADPDTLLAAVVAQTPKLMAKGPEFCPHPATWLNGERWADETPGRRPAGEDPDAWMRRRPAR